jgi:hypothetical protein
MIHKKTWSKKSRDTVPLSFIFLSVFKVLICLIQKYLQLGIRPGGCWNHLPKSTSLPWGYLTPLGSIHYSEDSPGYSIIQRTGIVCRNLQSTSLPLGKMKPLSHGSSIRQTADTFAEIYIHPYLGDIELCRILQGSFILQSVEPFAESYGLILRFSMPFSLPLKRMPCFTMIL